ncbi:MAG: patatin-like phospholipase family protein [Saprospiraceae bacterium]|nr:patatin-like phospholipase family protein [Saprospiraceae bacterium]
MHNKYFIKDRLHELPISIRLLTPGPKRILSLDGGGIRGAISLGYLAEMEKYLRIRFNNPELVLSDYYDLIGGTSTGSIIATMLAMGFSVDSIEEKYLALGTKIFSTPWNRSAIGFLSYFMPAKFSDAYLMKALQEVFWG